MAAKLEPVKSINRNPDIDFESTKYCLEEAHELLSGAAKYGGLRVDVRDEMHRIARKIEELRGWRLNIKLGRGW